MDENLRHQRDTSLGQLEALIRRGREIRNTQAVAARTYAITTNVGGATFEWARRCVAFEGRIVVAGFTGGIGELRTNHVLLRNYSVVGLHLELRCVVPW